MAPNIQANGVSFVVEKQANEKEFKLWNQRRARLEMKRTQARSQLLQQQHEASLLQIDPNELVLGNLLGTGAFSSVYELSGVRVDCQNDENENSKRRRALANKPESKEHSPNYAIKVLRSDVDEDAVVDFLMEQKYLAALTIKYPHPNIVQLHGISSVKCSFDKPNDSFLILERVDKTLVDRMATWRLEERHSPNVDNDCWLERLDAALQLSAALSHLHRLKLMYRDLKPDNVGFIGSTVKLFDFGMVKELNSSCVTGMYCMSGSIAGTWRYMAPEVLSQRPYSVSADVYSFGIVLWQILSLEPFLKDVTSKRKCLEQVVQQNVRPIVSNDWSDSIKELLESCWAHPNKRPTMKHIYALLKKEIENHPNNTQR